MRSPFRLTCLRTAPTGGEEGGEPAGAVCAVAARWWCARGRRALVGDSSPSRAGSGASEEHTGQCAVRDSQISQVKQEKQDLSPRRQQTLQWSASARRAPQVVLLFEKPPAFLSHRLVQLRLDRWQRKASRRIRPRSPWMDAKKTSAAPHAAKPPRWRQLAEGFSLHARWSAGADGGMGATSSVAGMSL